MSHERETVYAREALARFVGESKQGVRPKDLMGAALLRQALAILTKK